MYPVTLSIEDVIRGSNNRTVSCAYASPTSNGLLEKFIHFTERARIVKGAFLRQVGAQKLGIFGNFFLIVSTFSSLRTFCFMLEPKFSFKT